MADVHSKAVRSYNMSCVRGKGNKETEVALVAIFRRHGITGWRRNQPVFGKPDFVFANLRVAVFVDGCFWHGCPKHQTNPANNAVFWQRKLAGNKARDWRVTWTLRRQGWRVVRIWEHELHDAERCAAKVLRRLAA